MAALDSKIIDIDAAAADRGCNAFIRVTDCEDGTARVQLDQKLSWPAVLELLRALSAEDFLPS